MLPSNHAHCARIVVSPAGHREPTDEAVAKEAAGLLLRWAMIRSRSTLNSSIGRSAKVSTYVGQVGLGEAGINYCSQLK